MATMYCALCGRPVEARRQIGVGTVVLAVLTAGVSLLAIPFYRRRCSICRSAAVTETAFASSVATHGPSPLARLENLEHRLTLAEGELEVANSELSRLRSEQEFYRQLLGGAKPR